MNFLASKRILLTAEVLKPETMFFQLITSCNLFAASPDRCQLIRETPSEDRRYDDVAAVLAYRTHQWRITTSLECWWNDEWQGKGEVLREKPDAFYALGFSPGLRGEKPFSIR
jgi:hypothetical protein